MKRIALEEHFSTEELVALRSRGDAPQAAGKPGAAPTYSAMLAKSETGKRMLDLGEGRLADMDRDGISVQVLCATGGLESLDPAEGTALAQRANDAVAKVVRQHPARFAAYAALAPQDPKAAAHELERAVKKLGLVGGKINSNVRGEYLDNPKYWEIFAAAEELGVPIFIHPAFPSPKMLPAFQGYPVLHGSIWGYAADTGLHAMRLICSGVFDEYPRLKIVLGHMGEALPFWLWRIDNRWTRENAPAQLTRKLRKKPGEYVRENFWVTTSGQFSVPALLCAYMTLGADRILFAVDYPHEDSAEAVAFLDAAPISPADREKIYHGNAEGLLGLAADA
ncbi:MAG: amidohydrolase family protein [Chloroflexota bacterium]